MRVLVVGSGGREHALCWKIAASPLVDEVFCAPGNAGIAKDAICADIAPQDAGSLLRFAKDNAFDLTVVGPEAPLVKGLADEFRREGLAVFGPDRAGAMLEGSKSFAKDLMRECCIPTGSYCVFTDALDAQAYIRRSPCNVVVKADGLASGKGVIVAETREQACEAVDEVMVRRAFGDAGARVVVEELLEGEEASFIAVCDGTHVLSFASSQDHKRALDGDAGPNTGGMGACSPAPVVDERVEGQVMDRIMEPLVWGLKRRGIDYRGVIYAGLMITDKGPHVLEFNVRMGDPETQPLLVRCTSDIVPVMLEVARGGSIRGMRIDSDEGPAVCVVLASEGYPGSVVTGRVIEGLDEAERMEGVKVFHAATTLSGAEFVTAGGRVLGVTALAGSLREAIDRAYGAVSKISFAGMHFRRDIGKKAIWRMP